MRPTRELAQYAVHMLDGVYDNLSELAHIARLTPAEEAEVKRMMHQTPYNELKELAK